MRKRGYKPWPKDGKPASFGEDILPPLLRAIRFAYDLKRRNAGKSVPWNGLDIGEEEKVGCHTPKVKLSRRQLKYSEEEQGRDVLEEIVGLAVQLGIEQGRRIDRTSTIRSLSTMLFQLKFQTEVDKLVQAVADAIQGKRPRRNGKVIR
jgi:hypothetical protein